MVPSADKILRTVRPVSLPVRDGAVSLEGREDLQFVSVVNRYGNGKQVIGVFENFGLCEGAFATTITHDSHNLLVVYRDPESALKAVQALQACGGGICAVKDSKASVLELPVAGLMSNLPAARWQSGLKRFRRPFRKSPPRKRLCWALRLCP